MSDNDLAARYERLECALREEQDTHGLIIKEMTLWRERAQETIVRNETLRVEREINHLFWQRRILRAERALLELQLAVKTYIAEGRGEQDEYARRCAVFALEGALDRSLLANQNMPQAAAGQ